MEKVWIHFIDTDGFHNKGTTIRMMNILIQAWDAS